jgi:hypothetical protein
LLGYFANKERWGFWGSLRTNAWCRPGNGWTDEEIDGLVYGWYRLMAEEERKVGGGSG